MYVCIYIYIYILHWLLKQGKSLLWQQKLNLQVYVYRDGGTAYVFYLLQHSCAQAHALYSHLPQRRKCKQNSILYECSLQYTVRSVNLVDPEFARRQHHRRTDSVTEIHMENEYFCVVWRRYQWLRYCSVGDRWMNTETDERMCLNYWWKYGDRGKQDRTHVVTNDRSEAFLNSV